MPELSDIGEFGLIRKIKKMVGPPHGTLKVGIGDDAALFKVSGERVLATTDLLVENIHFDFKVLTPFEVGWQAMTANLSDMAAMGGWPSYALVGIGAKQDSSVRKIIDIYRGMLKLAGQFNCQIIGGDTVRTDGPLTLAITVIGFPCGRKVFLRSSAVPGDKILVTGWPGDAGLALKEKRFVKKIPRLKEIKFLTSKLNINALIDLSDGISSDLKRITEESKAGALIFEENLPASPRLKKVKEKERLALVLNGGEDFELLLTTPQKNTGPVISHFEKRFKIPLTFIGEIRPEGYGVRILARDGGERILRAMGYEHFKS